MQDLIKNFLYTGVGLVALAAEKVQTVADELVKQGKISQEEGKKIVDDFFKTSESRREEFEAKVKKMTESLTGKLDIFAKEGVNELRDRLEGLESKLTGSEPVKTGKEVINDMTDAIEETVAKTKRTVRKKATT